MTTNYERIKAMSVDEMAEFLENFSNNSCDFCKHWTKGCHCQCVEKFKQWLESEVENANRQ